MFRPPMRPLPSARKRVPHGGGGLKQSQRKAQRCAEQGWGATQVLEDVGHTLRKQKAMMRQQEFYQRQQQLQRQQQAQAEANRMRSAPVLAPVIGTA